MTCADAGITLVNGSVGAGFDVLRLDESVTVNAKLSGGSGGDALQGGLGSDKLSAGSGDDYLKGGDNSDQSGVGDGVDSFSGSSGTDIIESREADWTMSAGVADKVINCGGDQDTVLTEPADIQMNIIKTKNCEDIQTLP